MKKIFKWGAIIVVSLIVLTALFGSDESKETTAETPEIVFSENQVTEDSVKAELSSIKDSGYGVDFENITKVDVISQAKDSPEDPDVYAVSVFYTYKAWDDEDTVKKAAGSSVEAFRHLFAHPQVVKVATFAQQDFTDQYGKTETDTAVKFMMDRETAEKIEWDGVKDRVLSDYKALYPLTEYKIHPAISKNLE